MSFNGITVPGGLPIRIVRRLLKGRRLYDDLPTACADPKELKQKITVSGDCSNQTILSLFEPLKDIEGVSAYLHGSWADNTNNAFSDIDDLIVIDDTRMGPESIKYLINKLNYIDMSFCRIDPIQHHGHWIVSYSELARYDHSFIPLFILKEALRISGSRDISYTERNDKSIQGLKRNIQITCDFIEEWSRQLWDKTINIYSLKRLIGSFVLMPAFIFQLKGQMLNKPQAIAESRQLYSDASYQLIQWSTECRANWHILTNTWRYRKFSKLSYLFVNPHLWRRFAERFSPRLSVESLSSIQFTGDRVQQFLQESRAYVSE